MAHSGKPNVPKPGCKAHRDLHREEDHFQDMSRYHMTFPMLPSEQKYFYLTALFAHAKSLQKLFLKEKVGDDYWSDSFFYCSYDGPVEAESVQLFMNWGMLNMSGLALVHGRARMYVDNLDTLVRFMDRMSRPYSSNMRCQLFLHQPMPPENKIFLGPWYVDSEEDVNPSQFGCLIKVKDALLPRAVNDIVPHSWPKSWGVDKGNTSTLQGAEDWPDWQPCLLKPWDLRGVPCNAETLAKAFQDHTDQSERKLASLPMGTGSMYVFRKKGFHLIDYLPEDARAQFEGRQFCNMYTTDKKGTVSMVIFQAQDMFVLSMATVESGDLPRIDLEWNAPEDIARMLNEAMHLLKTEQRVKVTNDDVKFRDLRALFRNVF